MNGVSGSMESAQNHVKKEEEQIPEQKVSKKSLVEFVSKIRLPLKNAIPKSVQVQYFVYLEFKSQIPLIIF